MRNQFICTVLIIFSGLFSNAAFGQYDYRSGYIVTNDNDTIRGYVEYGNARLTSYTCYFKTDSLPEAVKYSPQDLKMVVVDNYRHYVSKDVQIEGVPRKMFLEYLVEGSLNMYFMLDFAGQEYFFAEKDGQLYELTNRKLEIEKDGTTYTKNSNSYIGVLKYLVQDSPSSYSAADNINFDHRSFVNFATDYHQSVCDSVECTVYSREQEVLNDVEWQVKIGSFFNYSFSKSVIYSSIRTIYNINFYPEGYEPRLVSSNLNPGDHEARFHGFNFPGFFINISPNWRTSFQMELMFSTHQIEADNYTLTSKQVIVPIFLKREFLYYNKLSPYVFYGFSLANQYDLEIDEFRIKYKYPETIEENLVLLTDEITYPNYKCSYQNQMATYSEFGVGFNYDFNKMHSIYFEVRGRVNGSAVISNATTVATYFNFVSSYFENSTMLLFGYSYSL